MPRANRSRTAVETLTHCLSEPRASVGTNFHVSSHRSALSRQSRELRLPPILLYRHRPALSCQSRELRLLPILLVPLSFSSEPPEPRASFATDFACPAIVQL